MLSHESGDAWVGALATFYLGVVAFVREDYPTASDRFETALGLFRSVDDVMYVAALLGSLAWIALISGDVTGARRGYGEALDLAVAARDRSWIAWCLKGLGGVAVARGRAVQAARLLGAAANRRNKVGEPLRPSVQAHHDRIVAAVCSALGSTRFEAAWAAGWELAWEQAIAEARQVIDDEQPRPAPPKHDPATGFGLTPREREILHLLSRRLTDKEIAAALFVGPRTVQSHVARILAKLGVASRREAAAAAERLGLA